MTSLNTQSGDYIRYCDPCGLLLRGLECPQCGNQKTLPVVKVKDRIYEFPPEARAILHEREGRDGMYPKP